VDEAERCHRLAILDRGALVADGAPAGLAGALQGRTLLVRAAEPRAAQRVLAEAPGVLGVAQIGGSLRVLAEAGGADAAALEARLRAAGLEAQVAPVAPNLEDVFVAATRGRGDPGALRAGRHGDSA